MELVRFQGKHTLGTAWHVFGESRPELVEGGDDDPFDGRMWHGQIVSQHLRSFTTTIQVSSASVGVVIRPVVGLRLSSGVNRRTAPPVRIPPSRPDTMVQAGSSTTSIPAIGYRSAQRQLRPLQWGAQVPGAFLRDLAVAFHRSPTSLRWRWTGERQIAVAVSYSHHRDRRTFPRRIPPGSRGRVAGA
jgi:hypothetical protein